MTAPPSYAGPPWAEPGQWAEANAAVLRLLERPGLGAARERARGIAAGLAALAPAMERLCAATCPRCLELCCLRARVWLDFRDLLFLHLSGQALPLGQLRAGPGEPCRHLGPRGCLLPRLSRPWVCTWYLCPEQKQRMAGWPAEERKAVEDDLARVKELRKEMEEAVVDAGG